LSIVIAIKNNNPDNKNFIPNKMSKTALALIIGNADYPDSPLSNPLNDARDFSKKLRKLGFVVTVLENTSNKQMDDEIDLFGEKLDSYDIGRFYFAGHGLQIEGENFITSVDTKFSSETSVQYSAVSLNKVLSLMHRAKNSTNIIILDACRNNPFETKWHRSTAQSGLAPMHAPKGTLIAFATSPGEKAKDGLTGNGLYTGALLAHIEDENISIEELFKRVRNTVSSFSGGKQTSWEHTSLVGTFQFNSGQIKSNAGATYLNSSVADKTYQRTANTTASKIIDELRSYNWDKQNPAIDLMRNIVVNTESDDIIFVLGRNILQTAIGGSFKAQSFMKSLASSTSKYVANGENHLMNGILFEMYFDSDGKFRYEKIKSNYMKEVLDALITKQFDSSLTFIQRELQPYKDSLFIIPSANIQTISLDIITNTADDEKHIVNSIMFEGINVLQKEEEEEDYFSTGAQSYQSMTYGRLKEKMANATNVPINQITFNSNESLKDDSKILYPYNYSIKRKY
jgi:hypothetical protein